MTGSLKCNLWFTAKLTTTLFTTLKSTFRSPPPPTWEESLSALLSWNSKYILTTFKKFNPSFTVKGLYPSLSV